MNAEAEFAGASRETPSNKGTKTELAHRRPARRPRTEAKDKTHADQAAEAAEAAGQVTPPAETPKPNANTTREQPRGPGEELPGTEARAPVPANEAQPRGGNGQKQMQAIVLSKAREGKQGPSKPKHPTRRLFQKASKAY